MGRASRTGPQQRTSTQIPNFPLKAFAVAVAVAVAVAFALAFAV
jgi:hypothetical protein